MNAALTLVAAAVVAAGTTFTVLLLRERPAETPAIDLTAHARQFEELRKASDDLAAGLRRLEERAVPVAAAPARSEVPAVSDAAIDAALERRLATMTPDAVAKLAGAAASKKSGGEAFDARAAFGQLTSGQRLSQAVSEALWKKARDAGKVDELVAMFEQRAKENPGVADVQLELGNAYLQRLFAGAIGPEQGIWGTKADKAFDAALELDPNHWEARFTKAVSLSHWPDFLGKKREAIKPLEVLIDQQERSGAQRPEHAQVYVVLSNLYLNQGNPEKAKGMAQKGATLFPDHAELKKLRAGQ